jgi:predicted carbohydrate-binding protein with CBM5 and CBM33 domain|tara:strand:+ start:80 stop:526 length:447 start_codon:yes stop_codon:yes gene_type:complete
MVAIVDKCFDNTKDGVPNYAIDLIDGTRLYVRGSVLNPMPKKGDAIDYTEVNTKTSANGNQYTNVKDVSISAPPNFDDDINQVQTSTSTSTVTNGTMKITDVQTRQRMDIFVTGVVGRSMGSGHFSVDHIEDLTKNAVKAFDEFLKNK